jgi:hypothetical protein
MSDNIITEFDVADAEEAMNQAILEYSNMCYLLGKQRGEEKVQEKKTYTVTAHFDGMMELTVQAASAEQAKEMAKHPAFRNAWVIDEDSTRINAIMKAEETE